MRSRRAMIFVFLLISMLSLEFGAYAVSPLVHDVAITNVVPNKTILRAGEYLEVIIYLQNQGTEVEQVGLTVFLDSPSHPSVTWPYFLVEPNHNYMMAGSLFMSYNDIGSWNLVANVTVVHGETDVSDNVFVYSRILVVTLIVPQDYSTIQEAINHANQGVTIYVEAGTYYEHVVVNKTVSLVGENRSTTIINGNGSGTTVEIESHNSNFEGFNVVNGSSYGILLDHSNGTSVQDCSITADPAVGVGVSLYFSSNNSVCNNVMFGNSFAVVGYSSHGNRIIINNLSNNDIGISFDNSLDNVVQSNIISASQYGIRISYSSMRNVVRWNQLINNFCQIYLYEAYNNAVYHNNLFQDDYQENWVVDSTSNNAWDNGCEGNYWSDYTGSDASAPLDGIGDTELPWQGVDSYPLTNRFWDPTDINHDLKVDIKDVATAAKAFGSYNGHPLWNPHADITGPISLESDGEVDIRDIARIAKNFGKTYS